MQKRHRWHPVAEEPRDLIPPSRLDPRGETGPTKRQAEGTAWIRTSHGLYVPRQAPRHLPEQRILEQAARLNAHGVVTGWAACRLWGAAFFDGLERDGRTRKRVPLNVGPQGHLASSASSFALHQVVLPDERAWRYGIPTVIPERAAYDAIRLAGSLRDRVTACDMATAGEVTSLRLLQGYAMRQKMQRQMVLEAVSRASEHSRSPRESELRWIAEELAGLPKLLVNCPIRDRRSGALVAIVDLLDVEAGLVLEMDGEDHRPAVRQAADLDRTRELNDLGLEVCRVVGFETSRPRVVIARIATARSRAAFLAPEDRLWVPCPPADDLHELLRARRSGSSRVG